MNSADTAVRSILLIGGLFLFLITRDIGVFALFGFVWIITEMALYKKKYKERGGKEGSKKRKERKKEQEKKKRVEGEQWQKLI
jgi:hypothetical protein